MRRVLCTIGLSLGVVALGVLWQAAAQADMIVSHVGSNDPATEGFTLTAAGGSQGTLAASTDSGVDNWRITEAQYSNQDYYSRAISSTGLGDLASMGWTATFTVAVFTPGTGASWATDLEMNTATRGYYLQVGTDSEGKQSLYKYAGGFVELTSGLSAGFHTYKMVAAAGATTIDILVDGASVATWDGNVINATTGLLYFGRGSAAAPSCSAGFSEVSLATTIPEPATVTMAVTGLLGLLAYAWRKRR